jgi:hypothetical protein
MYRFENNFSLFLEDFFVRCCRMFDGEGDFFLNSMNDNSAMASFIDE